MSGCDPEFYGCKECGTILEVVRGNETSFSCNGKVLPKLVPNTSDGAAEKHLPLVEQDGNRFVVKVGSVFHPMSAEHSIEWILLQTVKGCQRVYLKPDEEPVAIFLLTEGDRAIAAYAYCNLHGFWKTTIQA